MNENPARWTDPDAPPTWQLLRRWLGKAGYDYWKRAADMIETNYPGVFEPEWLYGDKKHGWSPRYKKSRSFCTFIPEMRMELFADEKPSGWRRPRTVLAWQGPRLIAVKAADPRLVL